jgi:hypothetical protein
MEDQERVRADDRGMRQSDYCYEDFDKAAAGNG